MIIWVCKAGMTLSDWGGRYEVYTQFGGLNILWILVKRDLHFMVTTHDPISSCFCINFNILLIIQFIVHSILLYLQVLTAVQCNDYCLVSCAGIVKMVQE